MTHSPTRDSRGNVSLFSLGERNTEHDAPPAREKRKGLLCEREIPVCGGKQERETERETERRNRKEKQKGERREDVQHLSSAPYLVAASHSEWPAHNTHIFMPAPDHTHLHTSLASLRQQWPAHEAPSFCAWACPHFHTPCGRLVPTAPAH